MILCLKELEGIDFEEMKAGMFEFVISAILSVYGKVERQVFVKNRGDGRRGRVDILYTNDLGKTCAIELDRNTPRSKSIFKLKQLSTDHSMIILRSPFTMIELK